MPKVSIIIPIYNAEKYLSEVLDSLLNQTLADFEIICVVDCPQDASREIVRSYQEKDNRIRIIENERNIGAALSRNRGIAEARAPYLCFFDADDIFEADLLETAYRTMSENVADIVLFEHDSFSEHFMYNTSGDAEASNYAQVFCLRDLPEEALTYWYCVPWNKMFRREFVQRHSLFYQDLPSSNDVYFSDMAMLLAERIVHLPTNKKYVHYRVNSGTQISANRDPRCAWEALKNVYLELKKRNLFDEYKKYFYVKFLHTMVSDFQRCKSNEKVKSTYEYIHQLGACEIGLDTVKEEDFDNPFYVKCLRKFVVDEYDGGGFGQYALLYARLEYNRDNILELYEHFSKQDFKIAVWGTGPNGRTALTFFRQHQKEIQWLIDNNRNVQGTIVEGMYVSSFEAIKHKVRAIFVPSANYYDEIRQQVELENHEIYVVNISDYVK